MIERAYTLGEQLGIAVWTEDEAGPYQPIPYLGVSWQPEGQPARLPHAYARVGTAKLLTLFHPATGALRVKGVTRATNAVLHPWLKAELNAILASLPEPPILSQEATRALWESWRDGLRHKVALPAVLPPLRLLRVMDNLKGHHTPAFVLWLFEHGILPLYTPLGASWLNMAESVLRIIKRRALDGHYPKSVAELIAWLEATAQGWNAHPTPFVWGGKRKAHRQRARERHHVPGGSGAYTRRPIPRRSPQRNGYLHVN